jgi:hypothetical protein
MCHFFTVKIHPYNCFHLAMRHFETQGLASFGILGHIVFNDNAMKKLVENGPLLTSWLVDVVMSYQGLNS